MNRIRMEHGSGGQLTGQLIHSIFEKAFDSQILSEMEDSAVVPGGGQLAITTDSFVVKPLIYPGGDIGRLSICGTVNDLLMRGAQPKYITCGFILQEGLPMDTLQRVVISMAETAQEAGVQIVAGDTKVIEGTGEMFINTAGVGFADAFPIVSSKGCRPGDVILVSGCLGDHHAALLSERLGIHNSIVSDNATLQDMVHNLMKAGVRIHAMRDVTRGGLATILKELALSSACEMELEETSIPVSSQVMDFCGLLGLDPLYMGNEGKMVAVVAPEDANAALAIMRSSNYGKNAAIIGRVCQIQEIKENVKENIKDNIDDNIKENTKQKSRQQGRLILNTRIGGQRQLGILQGEGLPRIC